MSTGHSSKDEHDLLQAIAQQTAVLANVATPPMLRDERSLLQEIANNLYALSGAAAVETYQVRDERNLLREIVGSLLTLSGGTVNAEQLDGDEHSLLRIAAQQSILYAGGDPSTVLLEGDERSMLSEIEFQFRTLAEGGGTPTVYLQDSFTGADNTELNGRAPDVGPHWQASANGNWFINGNRADNTDSYKPLFADIGVADCTIEVGYIESAWCFIAARYTDDQNYWRCCWFGDEGFGVKMLLQKVEGGVATESYGAATYPASTPTSRKVVLSGSTIDCYQDGVVAIHLTGATFNQTATKHGIAAGQGGTRQDDVLLRPNV